MCRHQRCRQCAEIKLRCEKCRLPNLFAYRGAHRRNCASIFTHHFMEHTDCAIFVFSVWTLALVITEGVVVNAGVGALLVR